MPEPEFQVVLDTNVFVAAFRSNLGASYKLLQTLETRVWRAVISPALALEYEAVLKRHASEAGLHSRDVDDFLEYLFSRSNLVRICFRWRPFLQDPNDDCSLELAANKRAAIVTYNAKDFDGTGRFGVRVIGPREFLRLIGGRQ